MNNRRIITGIKPTGNLHLGNYFGAIVPFAKMANLYDQAFIFIADYHACGTNKPNEYIEHIAAAYMSLPNSERYVIYRQSDIKSVTDIYWLLQTTYSLGSLQRCHAYKQAQKDTDNLKCSVFTYPLLMAADILSVKANTVTVGQDQAQHLEITADVARKFNYMYQQNCFDTIPQANICDIIVPGLDQRKMSKSYNNTINLISSSSDLKKAIYSYKTDSSALHAPKNWRNCSLFKLLQLIADPAELEPLKDMYENGISWYDVKKITYDTIEQQLTKFRDNYHIIYQDKNLIASKLHEGQMIVNPIADATLTQMKYAIGLSI